MAQVFDRPTPYTLYSTYVIPATKDRLESFVQLKDSAAEGTPAIKFLDPEVFGGERNPKRGEKALQQLGALTSGSFIVPSAGLKLGQYGNISAGTMTKNPLCSPGEPRLLPERDGESRDDGRSRQDETSSISSGVRRMERTVSEFGDATAGSSTRS
jgi:hypothetical protein